jgi:adenylyltransferase/sulfurtransferase
MAPINATEFMNRLQNGEAINVLDVREEIEYTTYNMGGKNIPLSLLPHSLHRLNYNKTDEIVVICKIGLRSETARLLLNENGYKNARNLSGGLMAILKLHQ